MQRLVVVWGDMQVEGDIQLVEQVVGNQQVLVEGSRQDLEEEVGSFLQDNFEYIQAHLEGEVVWPL